MRKPLGIQKCDGPTDRPTDTARCRVACPRLKKMKEDKSKTEVRIEENRERDDETNHCAPSMEKGGVLCTVCHDPIQSGGVEMQIAEMNVTCPIDKKSSLLNAYVSCQILHL